MEGLTELEVYQWRRQQVVDRILNDPEALNMSVWGMSRPKGLTGPACGTVACLAGHTALLAQDLGECKTIWRDYGPEAGSELRSVTLPGKVVPVILPVFAQEYLGLKEQHLFFRTDLDAEGVVKALLEEPYAAEETS